MDEGLLLQVNLLYEVRKFKARLVVRGDHQLEGVGSLLVLRTSCLSVLRHQGKLPLQGKLTFQGKLSFFRGSTYARAYTPP